ncbi:MAG: hypothetical protein A3F72_04870 [Bacteroidetes bacterium RIFCSPLOWO2_12_FULL_35_15]|nr:MAG: hypothetical protein A3F72_04870 [Bacteroidetes bacterium RIFCSPLOWO2_12_FULL_35_15]
MGLVFSLSNCKREKEIIVVNVHDTLKGKDITGLCIYPDYTNAMVPAKGAALLLYSGSSATGSAVASAFSDSLGNYSFKYLLPGTYFVTATYNTDNVNYKDFLHGINFVFDGVVITMGSSNITQNITLATVAAPGVLKIALDTIIAGPSYRLVTLESHSKASWEGNWAYGTTTNLPSLGMQGGFNVFKFTKFDFDEANPANIVINAYVQTSSINTFEPVRDALAGGCVRKTLNVDTMMVGTVVTPLPETDTIRFYANAGEVVRYGKGYLAHGHMKGFYKHPYGQTGIGGSGASDFLPADTSYMQANDGIPYGTTIDKPVDMYFEYISKNKKWSGTNYNWMFVFEGKFVIDIRNSFYIKTGSLRDIITVTPHVNMMGTTNREY